jgi:DNA-binding CsgD family transcriptional regulator
MPTLQGGWRVRDGKLGGNRVRDGQATNVAPSICTAGPGADRLLERGAELARIEQALAALDHRRGSALIIQGTAGIGKSSLLRAVCGQASKQGLRTLTARGSELERDFGFGIARQLLERPLVCAADAEKTELLTGAAALAGPVLGLAGRSGNSFAALHGLYWLVANLAAKAPLVLAIDDLQWADEPSLRWLVYLCHRLEGLPVLLAATTRPLRPGHGQLLADLLTVGSTRVLCPGPLSEPAVARLVRDGLGAVPDPAFVAACTRASGGNPYILRELIFDLAADAIEPVAARAADVAERLPSQVERTVLARLRRLDESATRLAQAVAVLGEGTGLRLAAEMANLDINAAGTAADALLTADLFDKGRPLQFLHPLVRSAVYEQLAPGARAQAHARAARLLVRDGAGCEQIGAQLLLCEPAGDTQAVDVLQAAAAAALDRGAPEVSVTYLRRALAEPPADKHRAAVLGELGGAERIARDPAAQVHLEQAWQHTTCPVTRALLAEQLANVLYHSSEWTRCAAVLRAARADLGDRDHNLAVRLCTLATVLDLLSHCPTEAPEAALRQLRDLAARNCPASRCAQLCLATILAVRGQDCHEVAELVERGLDGGRFVTEETGEAVPAMLAVFALIAIDELDRAAALVETILADSRARGSVVGCQSAYGRRAMLALRRGQLAEAEAEARAGLELATEYHLALSIPLQSATLGCTLLERGELDQASAAVEGVVLPNTGPPAIALLETRGRVRLAQGQRQLAIADLRQCGQLASAIEPTPNMHAWRSTLALALVRDDLPQARALAAAELELARRAGAPRAIGIALRACGLLAGGRRRIELLQQSVAVLESSYARLELARSLTELGAALRRAGACVAARPPLRRALDIADRCGATPLVARARDEALAAGARPRRPRTTGVDALTPSELRVARLAAQSLTNRDIAQALFITSKTVSDHLSSAYRKLNITSRDQLALAMTVP